MKARVPAVTFTRAVFTCMTHPGDTCGPQAQTDIREAMGHRPFPKSSL